VKSFYFSEIVKLRPLMRILFCAHNGEETSIRDITDGKRS